MLYFKRLLIVIVLILSITTLHAQNTTFSFKTNDVITIGHNGFYIADFNGPITEDLNNQPTTGINVFCGKPIGVATEEEGLSTTALWKIVEFKNKNGNTVKGLRNLATGNYLYLYIEHHRGFSASNGLTEIRLFKDCEYHRVQTQGDALGQTLHYECEPFELSETTIYNGGNITIWTLFSPNKWNHFTLEYKNNKWVIINATSWITSYNAVVNSVGTTSPAVYGTTPITSIDYELVGQTSYSVPAGGGIFDMVSLMSINCINATYYKSNTSNVRIYTSKTTKELDITSITLAGTNTSISGQIIRGSQIEFPSSTISTERRSVINATYKFTDEGSAKTLSATLTFIQIPEITKLAIAFAHRNGKIQDVHTDTRIIYAVPNQKRHLTLPLEGNPNYKRGYYRWYNYTSDSTVRALLFGNAQWQNFANNKGACLYGNTLATNTPDGTCYMFTGKAVKVAVDISQYTDYSISGNTFTEPTLSNRVVYDIRNASEIARKLDATSHQMPLEHYVYYAPCGETIHIGPAYRWTGSDCNYFINTGAEYPTSIDGNAVWTKNGQTYTYSTIYDSRLIPIVAPATLSTPDEYVLYADQAKTKVIAHFHVYASPKDKIGPKLGGLGSAYTNQALGEKYKAIGITDFNKCADNTPLAWDQSTYGYYYTNKSRAITSLSDGEYGIFQTYKGLSNKDADANGKFVYVKTNSYPGKIADLKIEDGKNLCPGSPVFISAWVANVGDSDPHASLRFVVFGVNKDGSKTNLITYVTGQIPTGGWNQILFQIQLDQIYYDEYHLHVENNGQTSSDDFAIDDIRMYTTKPLVEGFGGLSACDMNKEKNLAALRIDYCLLTKTGATDSLYYQWRNGQADNLGSVLSLNYINPTKSTRIHPCGAIAINSQFLSATTFNQALIEGQGKRYYPSIEAFLYSNDASQEAVHEFYTIERDNGKDHLILYIVHSNSLFQEGNYYTAQVMQRVPDFTNINCGAYYTYMVRPRTALTIDGIVYDDAVLKNLSINGEHTLGIQVYGFDSDGNIATSTCNADWFKYKGELSSEALTAIRNFRYEYPTATSLQTIKGKFEQRDYNMLAPLIAADQLRLNQSTVDIIVNEAGNHYIAIPVIATSFSNEFMACDNPLYVTLGAEVVMSYAKNDGNGNVVSYDNLPDELKGSPVVLRVAYSNVASLNQLSFTIDYLNDGFTSLSSNKVVLYTADHNGPEVYEITSNINNLEVGKTIKLNKNSNFKFEAGKSYVFHCAGYNDNSKVNPGTFIIHVVPDVVVWKPRYAGLSTAWHNDDNWASLDSYNNPYATTRGFIPLSNTNVIIPELSDTKYAPILSSSNELEDGSNEHLSYEFGVEFNTCKNIYFDEGAALANHHMLTYQNAYVDMHFDSNNGSFELKSVPMNSVYSGDFYIPKAGDEATTGNIASFNFAEAAAVDTRVANQFRQKTFNASVTQVAGSDKSTVKCETSTWSETTNDLGMPWQVGRGYAIAKQTATAQSYVRLPKTATDYYFFYNNNGQEGEMKFDWAKTSVSRTNSHKFAFSGPTLSVTLSNNASGNIFLLGNPFMCNLSISKLYELNDDLIDNRFYYTYNNGIMNVEFLSSDSEANIPPMGAVFIKTKTSQTSITIPFSAEMMYYRYFDKETFEQTPRRANAIDETLTITASRNGRVSKTTVQLAHASSHHYTTNEDAPLLMLDAEFTPFAIHTVADSQALMHNAVPDIYMIPLTANVIDGEPIGDITIQFSGVDALSCPIYLYDSYDDIYLALNEADLLNLNIEHSQQQRYYLTSRRAGDMTTPVDNSLVETVKVLNRGNGNLLIYTTDAIQSVGIYTLAGQLIFAADNINANQFATTLPPHNVYIFDIVTTQTVSKQKIVVK
jgi:hypothetical protein